MQAQQVSQAFRQIYEERSSTFISSDKKNIEPPDTIARQAEPGGSNLIALNYAGVPQLIIQGVPNRSVSIPKRVAQKVSLRGILISPFSANAWKRRSASLTSVRLRMTEKP
jgi:hypothetical protein